MKRVIDLKGKAKERQEAKKKAAANTASVERCKYWCKTSKPPGGKCHGYSLENLGFLMVFICRFGKPCSTT